MFLKRITRERKNKLLGFHRKKLGQVKTVIHSEGCQELRDCTWFQGKSWEDLTDLDR